MIRLSPSRDMTGEIRWTLVKSDGSPAFPDFHYPSERVAMLYAATGEKAIRVRVTARTGPFSDSVEKLEGEHDAANQG